MSKSSKLLFLFIVLFMSVLYEYQDIFFMLPQSLHDWRQTDCASFAMMYYQHGMKFFEPRVFNVLIGNGNAAGECPLLYYFIACLYKIFGPHEFIFRGVCLFIFYGGLLSLLNITYRFLSDRFYAFYVPVLLFSSPLIMFFANNFLCDVPSLSMVFIAWDFILKYRDTEKLSHFWLSMLAFALAGLLKANGLISFIALGGMFFLELNNWILLKDNSKLFVHLKSNLAGFVLVLLVVGGWYSWAIHYNDSFGVSFLGTKAWPGWPVWEASEKDFLSTVTILFNHGIYMFHMITCAILIFLLFFINANRQHANRMLYGIFLLTFIGATLFFLNFFVGFHDNIYYFINIMIVPVLIIITTFDVLKRKYNMVFNSIVFKGLLLAFLVLNVSYSKGKQNEFYHEGKFHYHSNKSFYDPGFRPFLDSIGILKSDLIISYPDNTPDVTLYLMRRSGWSEYNCPIKTENIDKAIEKGAKYLVLNNPSLAGDNVLSGYTSNFVANYNSINIYKLSKDLIGRERKRSQAIKIGIGQFVAMDNEEKRNVLVNSDSLRPAQFFIIPIGADKIAIKTEDGKFFSSDKNGDGEITSSTPWLGEWEQFKLIKLQNGKYAIQAVNGKYVKVNKNGGRLFANGSDLSSLEPISFESSLNSKSE
jgi:hypothetical protein